MQKLDRLGWAGGLSFTAYGHRIGIRVTDESVLERVVTCLPPGWKPSARPEVDWMYSLVVGGADPKANIRRFNLLYFGAERLERTNNLENVFTALESSIQMWVAEFARGRVFVHAGVVGWKGRAIVLPGRSFAGKSTLVAALVEAGGTYYSDEYAVFDSRGRVHPFARPIALRKEPYEPPRKDLVSLDGHRTGRRPLPVGLVVLTSYRAGARWRPRAISPGNAFLGLLANTLPARRQPEAVLKALTQVVSGAPALKGLRGEATELAPVLLEAVSGVNGHMDRNGIRQIEQRRAAPRAPTRGTMSALRTNKEA